MPPPGQCELAGADHTHGGPQVRDPYRGLGSKLGYTVPTISIPLQEIHHGSGIKIINKEIPISMCQGIIALVHVNDDSD